MSFFNRKRNQPAAPTYQQVNTPVQPQVQQNVPDNTVNDMLSEKRFYMNRIIQLLSKLDFVKIRRKNSEEILSDTELSTIQTQIAGLIKKISEESSAKLVSMNLEKIDKELLFFAEHLEGALMDGYIDTAKTYIRGLSYGIVQAHKDILQTDVENADKIIELRINKINAIKDVADLRSKADKYRETVEKLRTKGRDMANEYNQSKQELKEDRIVNKHIYDKIDRLAQDGIEPLDSDVRETARRLRAINMLRVNFGMLQDQIVKYCSQIDGILGSIGILETKEIDADVDTNVDYNEVTRKAYEEISRKMELLDDAMVESDKLFTEMEADLDRIRARADVKETIINSSVAMKEALEREERREKEREQGMKDLQAARMKEMEELKAKIEEQERMKDEVIEENDDEENFNPMLMNE